MKHLVFSMLAILLLIPPVLADEATTFQEIQIEQNYSYSPYLGSGFYGSRSDERSIFVLNIPVSYDLVQYDRNHPELQENDWGLRLNTTISAGFFDYDPEVSLPELELPSGIGTLVILPGIEFIYPVNHSWTLHPFLDIGLGHNFEADSNNLIYGAGIKSYFDFRLGNFPFLLGNRLYRTGFRNRTLDTSNSFAAFETGLNMIVARGSLFGRSTDFSLYYMNFIFSDNLSLVDIDDKVDTFNIQNELGISFGASESVSHTLVGRPRIGLGVRFEDGERLYRLVFGYPFF